MLFRIKLQVDTEFPVYSNNIKRNNGFIKGNFYMNLAGS